MKKLVTFLTIFLLVLAVQPQIVLGKERLQVTTKVKLLPEKKVEITYVFKRGANVTQKVFVQERKTYEKQKRAENGLISYLVMCSPHEISQPSLSVPGLKGRTQIIGPVGNKCQVIQTTPNSGTKTCLFSRADRDELRGGGGARGRLLGMMDDPKICN